MDMRTKIVLASVILAIAVAGMIVIHLDADESYADADGIVIGYGSSGTGSDTLEVFYWTEEIDGEINSVLYIQPGSFTADQLTLYVDGSQKGKFQLPYARAVAFANELSAGEHAIRLTNSDGSYRLSCVVNVGVAPAPSTNDVSVGVGESKALGWELGDIAVASGPVWASSDADKASVSDGTITGVAAGPAAVTIKYDVWTHTYDSVGKKITIGTQSMTLGTWNVKVIADVEATAPTAASPTYTGEAQSLLTAGTVSNGIFWYSTDPSDQSSWSTQIPTGIDAGSYTVYWKVVGSSEYYRGIDSTAVGTSIGKATYDMEGIAFANDENVYNGSNQGLEISGTLPTGADGIKVTVSYSGMAKDVGQHTISATFATVSGNYVAPSAMTAQLTITAKALPAISDIGNAIYNGSVQTPTVAIMDGTTALVKDMDFTLSWDDSGFTDAGTYNVTATGTGNYSGTQTQTYVIDPITVKVQKSNAIVDRTFNKVFDGTKAIAVADQLSIDAFDVLYDDVAVNEHQVTIVSQEYDESDATENNGATKVLFTFSLADDNHVFAANNGTLEFDATITKKDIPSIAGLEGVVYNTEDQIPDIVITDHDRNIDLGVGTDYSLVWKDSSEVTVTSAINAGTYVVVVTGIGNYSGSWTKTFAIAKAPLSFGVAMTGWAEGSFDASVNMPSVVVENGTEAFVHPAGAAILPVFTFNDEVVDADALSQLHPGNYAVKAVFAETDNYLSGEVTVTFNVYAVVTPVINGTAATIESSNQSIAITNSMLEAINSHVTTVIVKTTSEGGYDVNGGKAKIEFPEGSVFESGDRISVIHVQQSIGYTYEIELPEHFRSNTTIKVSLPVPTNMVTPKVYWNNTETHTWEEIDSGKYDFMNGYMLFETDHNSEYQIVSAGEIGLSGMSFANDFRTVHFFLKPLALEPEEDVTGVELMYSSYLDNGALKLDNTKTVTGQTLDEHGNMDIEDSVVYLMAKLNVKIRGSMYVIDWIECIAQDERTFR